MPLGDILEGIDADQQEKPIRFLERLLQTLDGVDGVVRFRGSFLPIRLFFARSSLESDSSGASSSEGAKSFSCAVARAIMA